ncbi:carbohydrate-binding module family 13 protein [Mycena floridula]|nr:carbohydrate-binding module family 13 protein [Mycena floridula]
MRSISIAVNLVLLAVLAVAQKPKYKGQLLIEPGLDTSKCLTGSDTGAVTVEDCTADVATSQQWTFSTLKIGKNTGVAVQVIGTTMCLEVVPDDHVTQSVRISPCAAGDKNQLWSYNYKSNTLTWANTKNCLDITATDAGTAASLFARVSKCSTGKPSQVFNVGYSIDNLPHQSEDGQYGINDCTTTNSQSSKCQTAWINSASDFCLWAPPSPGKSSTIGNTERKEVAWCTKTGRGTRTIPNQTLKGVHFVKTQDYVQITAVGDFTKVNIPKKDEGGELDPHGADGKGNPIGGLVYGNTFGDSLQYHEWSSFISDNEFCFKACVGCRWNMPGDYSKNVFEDCEGDDTLPAGIYGTSTFHQGAKSTPKAHKAGATSNCVPTTSVASSPLRRSRPENFEYIRRAPEPTHL